VVKNGDHRNLHPRPIESMLSTNSLPIIEVFKSGTYASRERSFPLDSIGIPESSTNLVTALSSLQVNDFAHFCSIETFGTRQSHKITDS
jgi:hypothetical protein